MNANDEKSAPAALEHYNTDDEIIITTTKLNEIPTPFYIKTSLHMHKLNILFVVSNDQAFWLKFMLYPPLFSSFTN
jgi:hypothetical protein